MSPRSEGQPRRRFRRRTVRILVDFQHAAGVRCEYATTLGACGLFIESEEPLDVGEQLKVRFRLTPEGPVHEIEGRVVWNHRPDPAASRAPGMGIEFTDSVAASTLARELDQLP